MPILRDEEPVRRRDGSVMVFLSLYLLLLAFFILLNTISQREQRRSQMAIGSVAATFRAPLPTEVVDLTTSTGRGVLASADPFHRQIKKVFEDTLPIDAEKVISNGNVMRISVPADNVFHPNSESFRTEIATLLEGIADGVTKRDPGVRFEVEMVIESGSSVPAIEGDRLPLPLRRAGAFARRMRSAGVAAHSVIVGIGPGSSDDIQFSFYAREIDRSRVSFTELAAVP